VTQYVTAPTASGFLEFSADEKSANADRTMRNHRRDPRPRPLRREQSNEHVRMPVDLLLRPDRKAFGRNIVHAHRVALPLAGIVQSQFQLQAFTDSRLASLAGIGVHFTAVPGRGHDQGDFVMDDDRRASGCFGHFIDPVDSRTVRFANNRLNENAQKGSWPAPASF